MLFFFSYRNHDFYLATYIDITEQPERYRGWSLYFPDTSHFLFWLSMLK